MAGGKYVFKYGKNILKKYLAPVNQRNITIRQVANAKSKQRNLYYKVGCGKTLKNVHNVLQSLPQSSQQSCDLAAPPQSLLMAILATAGRLSSPGRNVAKWGTRGGRGKHGTGIGKCTLYTALCMPHLAMLTQATCMEKIQMPVARSYSTIENVQYNQKVASKSFLQQIVVEHGDRIGLRFQHLFP